MSGLAGERERVSVTSVMEFGTVKVRPRETVDKPRRLLTLKLLIGMLNDLHVYILEASGSTRARSWRVSFSEGDRASRK